MTIRFFALAISLIAATHSTHAAIVNLTIESDPGDFIGQGNDFDLQYHSSQGSSIIANVVQTIGGAPSHITLALRDPVNGGPLDTASIRMSSHETGAALMPATYVNAVRVAPLGSNVPVFDLGFQGRGNNMHTASFTISDIAFSGSGPTLQLDRLVATFQQRDPDRMGGLTGTVNFNLTAVPEPSGIGLALFGMAMAGMYVVRYRRSANQAGEVG